MRMCGNCEMNGSVVYTSNPPKYRCGVTGEYHNWHHECDVELAPVRMSDLISRRDAIDALSMMQGIVAENGVRKGISMAWQQIADLPPAERRGRWELAEDGWYCSACELYPPFDCDPEEKGIPFCPWCGARMVRGEEE